MADWFAFEELEPAFERTKDLLLPFDKGTWGRLLIIVIFTGSGLNIPGSSWSGPTETGQSQTGGDFNADVHQVVDQPVTSLSTGAASEMSLIIIGAALLLGLAVFLFLISSVMSLVYYQSLLDDKVRIRKNFKKNFGKGVSYFGFQLTVILSMLLLFGLAIFLLSNTPIIGGVLLLTALILILPVAILLGLTNNFVLPRMIESDEKVVEAWRNVYPDLRSEWKQTGVYILVRFALKILGGMIGIFWALTTLIMAIIAFGLVALPLYFIMPVLVAIPVVIGLLVWLLSAILIQIPIQTYLRYYAILVYHDLTS